MTQVTMEALQFGACPNCKKNQARPAFCQCELFYYTIENHIKATDQEIYATSYQEAVENIVKIWEDDIYFDCKIYINRPEEVACQTFLIKPEITYTIRPV